MLPFLARNAIGHALYMHMSPHSPTVSIGMPVYNGESLICQSIDSILAQTWSDFELIISDNASTDNTEIICREYVRKDSRVKYFRNNTNLGAAPNFNRVFELSRGELFRWHSADDLCDPSLVEKCKHVLDNNPDVVLCCPKINFIDQSDNVVKRYDDRMDLRFPRPADRFRGLLMRLGICNAQFGLMRSAALRKTRLEGNYPGGDGVFLAELTLYGKFWQLDEYLFYRRFHPSAHSSLVTLEERLEFADSRHMQDLLLLDHWRRIAGHYQSIIRAPLHMGERIALGFFLLRVAWWHHPELIAELRSSLTRLLKRLKRRKAVP